MEMFVFIAYNLNGQCQENIYCCQDFASGLDMLTELINQGWELINVNVLEGDGCSITIPIEAFDGRYFEKPLKTLQVEWEDILSLSS